MEMTIDDTTGMTLIDLWTTTEEEKTAINLQHALVPENDIKIGIEMITPTETETDQKMR
jgi:hypothetical protein